MRRLTLLLSFLMTSLLATAQKAPVFLYAGQSNADGREYTQNLPDYMKNGGALPSSPYTHLHWASICGNPSKQTFGTRVFNSGERYAFCDVTNYWIDQASSQDFYAIKCAYGGTAIAPGVTAEKLPIWYADAEWMTTHNAYKGDDITQAAYANNNSLTKNLTEGFASLVDGTLAAIDNGYDVKAIMWHQGESDRNAASSYYTNFKTMIAYMRQAIYQKTGDPNDLTLPFIFGTVCRRSTQYNATVEAAQKQVAAEDENCYVIDMKNATLLSDNLHFNRQATEYLGKKMYNLLVELGLVSGSPVEVEEFPVKESVMDGVVVPTPDNRSWNLISYSQETKDALSTEVALTSGSLWNQHNSYGYRRANGMYEEQLHTSAGYVIPETEGLYFSSPQGNRVALNTSKNCMVFVTGDPTVFIPKLTAGQLVTFTVAATKNTIRVKLGQDMNDFADVVGSDEVGTGGGTVTFRVKHNVTLPTHIGFQTSSAAYIKKIEVKTPETVTVLIGADRKETFASDKPLDFTPFADLFKAYIVKGYRNMTGNVVLEQVDQVPANTGVLLMGEECQVQVPVAEGVVPALPATNLLTAVVGQGTAPAGSFVLTTSRGETLFTKTATAVSLNNQAYLLLPDATLDSYTTKQFTAVSIAKYDANRKAAISYTFDDGIQNQYTLAYPEMKKRGIRATFAIIGSKVGGTIKATNVPDVPAMTWDQIREMAADGFEIASHGWAHKALPNLSEEALHYEVEHNDEVITEQVGQFPLTFVYPGNSKNDAVVAYVESNRVGSRTSQTSFGGGKDLLTMNNYVNDLISNGSWGVTMTHAIVDGYDHFSDPTQLYDHWDYVTTLMDQLWVAPFCEVAAYVKERDNVEVVTVSEDDSNIVLILQTTLNTELFRQPLTLLVDTYADAAQQDGQALTVDYRGGKTIISGVSPVGGSVTIHKSSDTPLTELDVPSFQIGLTETAGSRFMHPVVTLSHAVSGATFSYRMGTDGTWTALDGSTFEPTEKGVYAFRAEADGYQESAASAVVALAPCYDVERTIDLTSEELYNSVVNATGAFSWGDNWGFSADQEFGKISTNKIGGLSVQNSNLAARYSYAKGVGLANNYGYTYGVYVGTAFSFADYQLYQNHSLSDIVSTVVHNPTAKTMKFPSQKTGAIRSVDIYEPVETASVIVDVMNRESTVDKHYFNLNGQRLASPVKGINIVGGKKVFIK